MYDWLCGQGNLGASAQLLLVQPSHHCRIWLPLYQFGNQTGIEHLADGRDAISGQMDREIFLPLFKPKTLH